ncbi:MAG: class I SAM-dependent methyltransferase [Oligoflexia bacterium]|nr:class I SAM-dependent methyltransferase [Oligoflexia bacterium]
MCTIGYVKGLNLLFKNRDKNCLTTEVTVIKPNFLGVKTENADYYSCAVNRKGCAFVSAAVNTPIWTRLASQGLVDQAKQQSLKENEGLINPIFFISRYIEEEKTANEIVEKLLDTRKMFMGYNVILSEREKVFHLEIYRDQIRVHKVEDSLAVTNHFKILSHGPKNIDEYPNSFHRLDYARKMLGNIVCIEDLFKHLRPPESKELWRNGAFYTLSSSILDVDYQTVYYTSHPEKEYARISSAVPVQGEEKLFIEMSRYIDLPTYHKIERGHPFYEEMLTEIHKQIKEFHSIIGENLNTLELGSGTGICSNELINHAFLNLDCLEIDENCCNILRNHPEAKKFSVIRGDAIYYCIPNKYDLIISTFAHDHIHFDNRFDFSKNIHSNLKKGGRYIVGCEILHYFSNENERKKSLFRYHNHIIDLALKEDRVQLCELENNALKSGLNLVGDFKRHEAMFEEEMSSSGMKLFKKMKIGPFEPDDVGGVFVYVFEKN